MTVAIVVYKGSKLVVYRMLTIQYTLNDYEKECLEKGVPSVEKRIDTFKRLVDELGFGHVVWRFDPLMLTDQVDIPSLMENFYRGTFERVYRKTSI